MARGSRKGQARWIISSGTGVRRELVGFVTNSRVRHSEAWMCLDTVGIPACAWYKMPLWIKIDTEPLLISCIIDLAQARKGCSCHDGLSMPMYYKM